MEIVNHLWQVGGAEYTSVEDAAFLSNRDDYKRSLNFLVGVNADILCEGHFGGYRGKEAVKGFIRLYL